MSKARFAFLSDPNILAGPFADLSDSIYEVIDYWVYLFYLIIIIRFQVLFCINSNDFP